MISRIIFNSAKDIQSWILLGIPVAFILGAIMHFVYGWSGKKLIAGLFTPVNESVWEHLKMAYWPMLLWWLIGYFVLRQNISFQSDKWFVAGTMAILTTLIAIVALYYTYTGALGFHGSPPRGAADNRRLRGYSKVSLFIDIFSFFVSISIGQLLSLHLYKYYSPGPNAVMYAFLILITFGLAFMFFTVCPPHLPIFKDPTTGKYGVS